MIYILLFFEFLKIGLFTFGGGYAMIPLLKETVMQHQWLTETQFYDFIGVCESTPGPAAINMATFVGTSQAGFLGGVVATIGVVLPSFIIIVLVASILQKAIDHPLFQRALKGTKAVILGLIFSTGLLLLAKALGYASFTMHWNVVSIIVLLLLCLLYGGWYALKRKKMSAISIILFSAIAGMIVSALL